MRANAVQVVYGPGTFLNRSVSAVNQEVTAIPTALSATEVEAARGRLRARAWARG